jgi:transcriptional regulator with XRE-family HTH domain
MPSVMTIGVKPYPVQWGETIRQMRTMAGLDQTQLAEILGVTQSIVSQWEKGKSEPRSAHKIRIAAYFRTDPNLMFPLPIEKFEDLEVVA